MDPRIIRDLSTKSQAHVAQNDLTIDQAISYQETMRGAMMVWKTSDFSSVAHRASRCFILTTMFSIMISKYGPHNPDDQARQMLITQPEIVEYLTHLNARRKKSQEG